MARRVNSYTPEFRAEATRLYRTRNAGETLKDVADRIGMSDATLRYWVNKADRMDAIADGNPDAVTHACSSSVRRIGKLFGYEAISDALPEEEPTGRERSLQNLAHGGGDTTTRGRGRPRGGYIAEIPWVEIERLYVYGEEQEVEGLPEGTPKPRTYPSLRSLSERFSVHASLIGRRSRSLRWMERRENFRSELVDETDRAVARALALSTADAVALIDTWVLSFEGNLKDARVRADNVSDLNTMLRLREFLLGNADQRSEQNTVISLEAMQDRHRASREVQTGTAPPALLGVISDAHAEPPAPGSPPPALAGTVPAAAPAPEPSPEPAAEPATADSPSGGIAGIIENKQ